MGLHPRVTGPGSGSSQHRKPLGFAVLATLGLIAKLLVVEKQLFSSREHELRTAVNAFQHPVLEFHCASSLGPAIAAVARCERVYCAPFDASTLYPGFGPPARGSVRDTASEKTMPEWMRGDQRLLKAGATCSLWPPGLSVLLLACLLACALARQRFLYPLFLAGFQVKRVTLYFLNNVLLLYLPLEATQGIF